MNNTPLYMLDFNISNYFALIAKFLLTCMLFEPYNLTFDSQNIHFAVRCECGRRDSQSNDWEITIDAGRDHKADRRGLLSEGESRVGEECHCKGERILGSKY